MPLLGGLSGGFGAIALAALPIIGIIAGIALAIYTVVRNFDKLKAYAMECFERIKAAFGAGDDGASNFTAALETVKKALGVVMDILEGTMLFAIKSAMNSITSAIQMVVGAFKVLWNVVKLCLWPIETVVKVIIGLFTGGWAGAIEALGGQFGKLGDIFAGIWDGIKTYIQGFIDFFKNIFKNAIAFVGDLFGKGLLGKIGNVFSSVKGFFSGGKTDKVAGHAEGGVFTVPHIAQIAEKGAEAVVPLNNTPQGFDIWKQAGELGGYLKKTSEQAQAVSAAAAPAGKTYETSPVMAAASQRISSGDTAVTVDFKMTNNFNGGTPDSNTVSQISKAGEKAGEDFESRVRSVFESIMRDRMRASYG
jgi:hypothetical protein